jgi:type IV conjugative transfer system coupling protein TraD
MMPAAIFGILAGLVTSGVILVYWRRRGIRQAVDEYIRGAVLADGDVLKTRLEADGMVSPITIGGIPIRARSEMLHTMISGAVGVGKSASIVEMLGCVRGLGKRAVVYDPTGEFIEYFYREGRDIILNPFDARSPNWNIWREIREDYDYRSVASALVPIKNTNEPFFDESARTVAEELFRRLAERGEATNRAVFDAAARMSLPDLYALLHGTSGGNLIDPAAEKTAISIRSTFMNAMNGFRHLHDDGAPFSIREWLADDSTDAWLFVSRRKDQHDAIAPLMSLWLDIAIRGVMDLPPTRSGRFWLVIDELPSLRKLESLQTAVAETRKYGLCGVFGIQSVSQMREIYGRDGAQTIMGMCQTWVVFRVADAETAEYLSQTLGQVEMHEKDEGLSFGAEANRDGTNLQSRRTQRAIVMPSEIQALPDFHGYMRVPGNYPVAKIVSRYEDRPKLAPPYIRRGRDVFVAGGAAPVDPFA